MVTTVWAKKPENPGKPSDPEPVIANYNIEIGEIDQDIIMNLPDSLLVENVVGGDWLPPPTKGKGQKGGRIWSITLPMEEGDVCGTYTFADVYGDPPNPTPFSEELASHGIYDDTPATFFRIEHMCMRATQGRVEDYWLIWIGWEDPATHFHGIVGRTNIDSEWEGEYLQSDEFYDGTWIVTFDDAEFGLIQPDDGSGNMSLLWAGRLNFTVIIKRTLD